MHTIKIWKDPYDMGWSTTRKKEIAFTPGVTVLVGCNGSGKTTLLHNIRTQLEEEKIPYYSFDNLKNGGDRSISEMVYKNNFNMVADMMCSSEGENILNNVSIMASKLRNFIINGCNEDENSFDKIFSSNEKDEKVFTNERWILLDAIDSGYSIDNIIDLKEFFKLILEDAHKMGQEVYIIVSANEYELASNMNCLDVIEGNYIKFSDYEDFKEFILKSRKKKNKRYYKNKS